MTRLNHHHLYIFWIFGKTGSFTKTAEDLRIAQSAVTSQIRNLESALEVELVDRKNVRRPVVTDAGRKVLEYADLIFRSSQELMSWATKGVLPRQKTIRIGAISGLSRNLQYEFIEPLLHKGGIKLEITTGDQRNLISLLLSHQVDVVLTSNNVVNEGRGHLYTNVLATSPVIFVGNKQVKFNKQAASLKEKLRGQKIFTTGHHFEAKPELDAYLEGLAGKFTLAGEIDDIALLRILALRSGAVVAIPELGVKNDIETKSIRVFGTASEIVQRFYAITRQKLRPNDDIKYLIESIRKKKL